MSAAGHGSSDLEGALAQLLETYYDLNSHHVDELDEEPSALEFMRYVARNRPFVVRGGAKSWPAVRLWSAEYLNNAVGTTNVNVALTPFGNADSVIENEDHTLSFVKPFERTEQFSEVLKFIQEQERHGSPAMPVRYGQTQNDNLRGEYSRLFEDAPADIPFARIALQGRPEAINLWLGNSRSATALHKDNYENVYAQVRGRKHFALLPPLAAPCVGERDLPAMTYAPPSPSPSEQQEQLLDNGGGGGGGGEGGGEEQGGAPSPSSSSTTATSSFQDLRPVLDSPPARVPVATWDPDEPARRPTALSHLARPLRVTLDEGDLLYLPAMWYHKVTQTCAPGGDAFCLALNYWFDMAYDGGFWAANAFVRDVAQLAG